MFLRATEFLCTFSRQLLSLYSELIEHGAAKKEKKKSVYKGEKNKHLMAGYYGGWRRKVKGKWKMNDGDPAGSTLLKQFVFCLFWSRQHNGPICFSEKLSKSHWKLVVRFNNWDLGTRIAKRRNSLHHHFASLAPVKLGSSRFCFDSINMEGIRIKAWGSAAETETRAVDKWVLAIYQKSLPLSLRAHGHPLGKQLGSTFSLQGRPSTRSINLPCLNSIVSVTMALA